MNKINILVLGVGGNVGQGILKALKISGLSYNVVTACISPDSLGLYTGDKAYISPYASDKSFIEWLVRVCNDEKIDFIITGVEEIIDAISSNYNEITCKTRAISVFSDIEQLGIGNDKYLTCEWLKNNGCNYPDYARSDDQQEIIRLVNSKGYPLLAKPRRGKGSQGIVLIHNSEDLKRAAALPGYIIQEYIGDPEKEYTIGCYCDKDGNFVDCIILHRLLKYGTTFKATVVENDLIREEVVKVCSKFAPKGAFNLQMRLSKGNMPVCFEMNVRLSGTAPIRARFGFNDVEALIREYVLAEKIADFFQPTKGTVYRYWDEFYISEEMQKELDDQKKVSDVEQYNNFTEGF